jgi:hypothetical protein
MNETLDLIEEMDNEILKATGGKPKEYDLQVLFTECQTYQKALYGGGEENLAEKEWIGAIKAREVEIDKRRSQLIEETEEVEELDDLGRDGIIIRR